MSVLEGNPETVTDRSADLVATSQMIESVIETFRTLTLDDTAKAVDKLEGMATEVRHQLERIHGRYDGTANALTDYAVDMTDCHRRAEEAYDDLQVAKADQDRAENAVADARHAVVSSDAEDTSQLEGHLDHTLGILGIANDAVRDAQDRIDRAREDMENAAEDARDRIDRAISDTNEDWTDAVADFFNDLGDLLEDIGDWVKEFFAKVVDFIQKLADMITAILSVLAILALLISLGPLGAILAGLLAGFIISSILSDVLAPAPEVTDLPMERPKTPYSLEDVLAGTGEVDDLGKDQKSVVKITKHLGPDGEWYYTVTLPSTQEWLSAFNGDHGAVNDLDSNLALVLTPALQTQYERAVLEAIEQAGITPEDNLMLVGFSQGGIMAGHLAAYNSELGVDAVVVSGAPIDGMPIPDSVDVVSIQHTTDVVPNLDSLVGDGTPVHGSNWTTIIDNPQSGGLSPLDVHNADKYSDTFNAHIDEIRADHPGLDNYYGDPTATSYYQWSE